MRRSRRSYVAVAAAVTCLLALSACGEKQTPLEQTQSNMAHLKAATIDLQLAASAGEGAKASGPVGFRLKGPYAMSSRHDLAVFDLTYTKLLGANAVTTEVRSTGNAAFVTTGGKAYRVADDDLAPLRVSEDAGGGFGDLGIAGWVENAKVRRGARVDGKATQVITGDVDVADLLSDLARVAGPLGGDGELTALDDAAGRRLQKLARSTSIEIVTGASDHRLRSLRAVMDFGRRAPTQLRETLGAYADARIEVRLALKQPTGTLRVEAPSDYVKL